ncbi:unnamed protein product [Lactuca saligna]|uniref:Uncharacterized protein n=1 Tax=Lactuca saligna TaxID=75948 RepID=A0AA35YCY1_LACSI|nr:unnamed protein product [Lactuca saligna]
MASSSETPSVVDQTTSSGLLSMKANQNLILDLDPSKYEAFLQPLIEFLRHSPLAQALPMSENAPLAHLSKAFSTARYQESGSIITFKTAAQPTSITKARYSRLLGFPTSRDLIDPESVSSSAILEMFYQMSYLENLVILSKFKKPNLPPMWNRIFTLIFRSFPERVTGSNSSSKLFLIILDAVK